MISMKTNKTMPHKHAGIDDYGIPNLAEEVISANMPQEKMKEFNLAAEKIREKYFGRV